MAAMALLVAWIWPVWALVEAPSLASVAADRARIALAAAELAAGNNGVDQHASLYAAQVRLSNFLTTTSWNLDRSSPELLSAQLQRAIDTDAAAAGAIVASSRTMPEQTEGAFVKIGLDFEIRATLPGLQALLLRIGQARPAIFVDRLTVQVAEGGGTSKGADGQTELGVALHVAIYAAHRQGTAA
jgi:hypothetical protein